MSLLLLNCIILAFLYSIIHNIITINSDSFLSGAKVLVWEFLFPLLSGSMMNDAETSLPITKASIEKLSSHDASLALPFRTSQSSGMIEGQKTQVITHNYADCILVIVTQVGKIGALVRKTS